MINLQINFILINLNLAFLYLITSVSSPAGRIQPHVSILEAFECVFTEGPKQSFENERGTYTLL